MRDNHPGAQIGSLAASPRCLACVVVSRKMFRSHVRVLQGDRSGACALVSLRFCTSVLSFTLWLVCCVIRKGWRLALTLYQL